MPEYITLSIAFLAGVITEIIIILKAKLSWKDYFMIAVIILAYGIFAFSYRYYPSPYSGVITILFISSYLSGIFLAFRHKTFPNITEASALIWNLVFLYYFFPIREDVSLMVNIVVFSLSIITLGINFYPRNPGKHISYAVYTWSIFMVLMMNFSIVFINLIRIKLTDDTTLLSQFVFGFGTMYVASILGGVIYLFPRKHESRAHKKKKAKLIKSKFSKFQTPIFAAILAIILIPGILYLNQVNQFIDKKTLIYIIIFALPAMINLISNKPIIKNISK